MSLKKLCFCVFFVFISLGIIAQVKTKHLEFEGVPINGFVNNFLFELSNENYEFCMERTMEVKLKAIDGIYKDWSIYVGFIPESKFVYKVYGLLSNQGTQDDILSEYKKQKKRLIEQYGTPSYSVEEYSIDSIAVDSIVGNDSVQYEYFIDEDYNYQTEFELPLGIVRLYLNSSYLNVEYIDSANSTLYDQVKAFTNLKVIQQSNESYKLFPTNNIWTFIKLDTRNGKMWQVQYDVGGDNRFEVELNTRNLAYGVDEENGRFTLYPTNNTYNFILLDQKEGDVWQVQWSHEKEERLVLKIR